MVPTVPWLAAWLSSSSQMKAYVDRRIEATHVFESRSTEMEERVMLALIIALLNLVAAILQLIEWFL